MQPSTHAHLDKHTTYTWTHTPLLFFKLSHCPEVTLCCWQLKSKKICLQCLGLRVCPHLHCWRDAKIQDYFHCLLSLCLPSPMLLMGCQNWRKSNYIQCLLSLCLPQPMLLTWRWNPRQTVFTACHLHVCPHVCWRDAKIQEKTFPVSAVFAFSPTYVVGRMPKSKTELSSLPAVSASAPTYADRMLKSKTVSVSTPTYANRMLKWKT